ncbi:TPA: tail fiber protein [Morganella morganii]|nr:tail fiber protein [Morganella morganii]
MAKNEFLPFGTAEGANVLSNQEYEALAARHNGFTSGVAKSKELNKVWRQASLIASAVAQFIVDTDQKDLLDTGDFSDIKARLSSAINLIISNGDYVTNPYLKLELLKKIDKADITQQLGNDTSKVASQNLLTTELGKKASVADANSKLAKDQNGADIPDKDTFIKNLGLGEKFQPKGNYLPFRTVNKLPGRGFTGAFSGDVNTTYVKGISVASAAGETDTGQFYVDPYAVLTVRYLNSNGAIQQNRIVGIPIGATIEWQSTAAIPENFLANDGRSFSASVYSELAKVFPGLKLPDDRGLFKRALDSGKGYDSGRTLGSVQSDAMRNLTGRFGNPTIEGGDFSEGVFRHSVNSGGRAAGAGGNSIAYSFDASRQVSTANEFRPVNKAVIYITRVI